jgi:two-component system response regulator DesR
MIRVLLVADVMLLRSALAAVLSSENDLKVVAELTCSGDVVPIAEALRADIAVIDLDPPGCTALAVAQAIGAALPRCHLLLLTGARMAARIHRLLDTRAHGLLGKDTGPHQLAAAIRKVAGGERVIDPALAVAALQVPRNPLTARELDVLRVAAEGASTAEIANRLHLSRGTVRNYVSSALRKTAAGTRVEAAHIAEEAGWL